MKKGSKLLEDTEEINEFITNFVYITFESAENVVGLEEDKPVKRISEETQFTISIYQIQRTFYQQYLKKKYPWQ